MKAERSSPRAHLVVDDFFEEAALPIVFKELAALDRRLKPGLVRDVGHDGQSVFFEHPRRKNHAVWVHDPSRTLRLFRKHLWSPTLRPVFETAREALFQIVPNCHAPNLQVSRYLTGDHYDFHEDEGAGVNLTVIVFLARSPEKVRGGDLELSYGGAKAKVPFRHNRLVIFPSRTLHRVTRVRVDGDDPRDARISLQSWLAYGPGEEAARPPEADRPTFLLSEPPIVAAAQALVTDGDQAPEALYWGGFYVSRILAQNLAWLAAESGLRLGDVRIRRVEDDLGGVDLEVYGGTRALRVGFALRDASVPPGDAVRLFVEKGRKRALRALPAGAEAADALAILRALLKR